MKITVNMLRYALRTKDPVYGYWFFRFYCEAFAEPLQTLSKKFLPRPMPQLMSFSPFNFEVEV